MRVLLRHGYRLCAVTEAMLFVDGRSCLAPEIPTLCCTFLITLKWLCRFSNDTSRAVFTGAGQNNNFCPFRIFICIRMEFSTLKRPCVTSSLGLGSHVNISDKDLTDTRGNCIVSFNSAPNETHNLSSSQKRR